jgi:hypothetical protein
MKIIREGHGTGEGRANSPGEVHDTALKAAETDATKRALATFGKPFGLELYRKDIVSRPDVTSPTPSLAPSGQEQRFGLHPDDTTPIPRPSHYYGRRHHSASKDFFPNNTTQTEEKSTAAPTLAPDVAEDQKQCQIDKSQLAIPEPKRLRDKAHLKLVASQPCLVCGRQPSDPHHLRFAQPRALGLKVSDEFTVPLCRGHHRELHQTGNEKAWWEQRRIRVLEVARGLWEQSHPSTARHSSSLTEK